MPKNTTSKIDLGLAPMYGVTDFPTRLWFYLLSSCEKMTTPFLRVTDTYPPKLPESWAPDIFDEAIKNTLNFDTTPQLMASCDKRFVETYFMFKDFCKDVEINCGCPSPKVVGHGAGSSLLRQTSIFGSFITRISESIGGENFCVKMRTGYLNHDNFANLIEAVQHLGLQKLTIHGRTKEERYSSYSRWDLIDQASRMCSFPVIASGDVECKVSYKKALESMPHIRGLIIGRGALKRPWVFHEIKTGCELSINWKALFYALACYALILELSRDHLDKLKELVLLNYFSEVFLLDESKWHDLFCVLYKTLFRVSYNEQSLIEVSIPTLGRIKLAWGYLLKGSCETIEGKKILRSKTSHEFFALLEELLIQTSRHGPTAGGLGAMLLT